MSRKKHRNKIKSSHRSVIEAKLSKKTRIDAYICTNMSFLGNPSFNISVDWRDINDKSDSSDPHAFWAGKHYFYTLSKRSIGNKWFNMDKVESEIKSMINTIKEKHPNVHIIGHIDCLQIIKKNFDGLYYRDGDLERLEDKKHLLID